jgi:chaperonin cofactor prefoldin
MASKKLSESELQILEDFQSRNNEIVVQVGATELRIDALERQKEDLLEKFQKLTEDQTKFGQELQEKYGDGNINLEKGEFTAAE